MKILTFLTLLLFANAITSQVDNAILDLTSDDKGLLLPRLADTSSVTNPTSGLMIYNQNTQSPAYHNGTSWNTISGASAMPMMIPITDQDSIIYAISGPGSSAFDTGTFEVSSFSMGAARPSPSGTPSFQDLSFTKRRDNNTLPFIRAVAAGTIVADIEFKVYKKGATSPYFSVKFSGWYTSSSSFGTSAGGELFEAISVSTQNSIGFKDWLTGEGFSYNVTTQTIGNY